MQTALEPAHWICMALNALKAPGMTRVPSAINWRRRRAFVVILLISLTSLRHRAAIPPKHHLCPHCCSFTNGMSVPTSLTVSSFQTASTHLSRPPFFRVAADDLDGHVIAAHLDLLNRLNELPALGSQ